jgi:hypothetical protein
MSQEIDLLPELRAYVARTYGKQCHAARAWRVSDAFVSSVLTGRKPPTARILEEAGLVRVITYLRKESA